jgi:hypothetical protein
VMVTSEPSELAAYRDSGVAAHASSVPPMPAPLGGLGSTDRMQAGMAAGDGSDVVSEIGRATICRCCLHCSGCSPLPPSCLPARRDHARLSIDRLALGMTLTQGVFVDSSGHVLEAASGNIGVLTKGGVLVTPPLDNTANGASMQRLLQLVQEVRARAWGSGGGKRVSGHALHMRTRVCCSPPRGLPPLPTHGVRVRSLCRRGAACPVA